MYYVYRGSAAMSITGFVVQYRTAACMFVGLVLVVAGCHKDNSVDPSNDLVTPFHGISKADTTGYVSEPDSDDWRPLSGVGMSFQPGAYPNPCKAGIGFVLPFHLTSNDSVVVTINDTPGHIVKELLSRRLVAGNYALVGSLGLRSATYRVYFRVVRAESTYVTYGDVQVEG
jgi:hypothetical protein